MKATDIRHFEPRSRARYFWSTAALIAAALFATTGPIFAEPEHGGSRYERHHGNRHHHYDRHRGNGRHHDHGRHHDYDRRYGYERNRGYDRHRYDSDRRYFTVPRSISSHHRHYYEDYYYGRAYYRDHRHYHAIYRFPVFVEGHLDYRPYAYCDGNYFATGYFGIDGPHFSIHIGF